MDQGTTLARNIGGDDENLRVIVRLTVEAARQWGNLRHSDDTGWTVIHNGPYDGGMTGVTREYVFERREELTTFCRVLVLWTGDGVREALQSLVDAWRHLPEIGTEPVTPTTLAEAFVAAVHGDNPDVVHLHQAYRR